MSLPIGPQGFPGKNSRSIMRFSIRSNIPTGISRNDSLAYSSTALVDADVFYPGIKARTLPVILPFDATISNFKFGIYIPSNARISLLLCLYNVNNGLFSTAEICEESASAEVWIEVVHPGEYFLKKGESFAIYTFNTLTGTVSAFGSCLITPS